MRLSPRFIFRLLAVALFAAGGANHFRHPRLYESIMPDYLPWPAALVAISGVAEIAGGLGLLPQRTRRLAGWGLIALLFAVWPANWQMAIHGFRGIPAWVLWARLPLQPVMMVWVEWVSRPGPDTPRPARAG